MSDSPAPDPLAAYLAEVRKRAARLLPLNRKPSLLAEEVAQDVPRLLAGYDALLARHKPTGCSRTRVCATHESWATSRIVGDIAARAACPECVTDEHARCWQPGCPDEWPCPDYAAISAALLGKEPGDA